MPIHQMYEKELKAAKGLSRLKNMPLFQLREFQNMGHKAMSGAVVIERIDKKIIPLDDWNLQIQIFYPNGYSPEQKYPVVMYFHGGGFIFGQYNSIIARTITKTANVVSVFVDYRLSPDYKFPIPLEDCYTASKYVFDNLDTIGGDENNFCICGDSAGGSLAIGVAQLAKERGEFAISKMLLIYPLCDHSPSIKQSPYNSYRECGKKYFLTADFIHTAENAYIRTEDDHNNSLIFGNRCKDYSVFPKCLVIVSEYDPLKDEGIEFAKRLKACGVDAEYVVGEGMLHAFMEKVSVSEVQALYKKIKETIL